MAYGGSMAVVYVDGCCFNNGTPGAFAGIGVYWGPDNHYNLSEKLYGRQTNNRAEIEAACRALEQADAHNIRNLEIITDSEFLIKSAVDWMAGWKWNGWRKANGEPVENAEDFKRLDSCMKNIFVKWTKVEGHSGIDGNVEADKLARAGAMKWLE